MRWDPDNPYNQEETEGDNDADDIAAGFKQPMSERIENYRYPDGHRHRDNPYINTASKLSTLKGLRRNAESQRQIKSKEQDIVEVTSVASREVSDHHSPRDQNPFAY